MVTATGEPGTPNRGEPKQEGAASNFMSRKYTAQVNLGHR